jgi:hypothetical protein
MWRFKACWWRFGAIANKNSELFLNIDLRDFYIVRGDRIKFDLTARRDFTLKFWGCFFCEDPDAVSGFVLDFVGRLIDHGGDRHDLPGDLDGLINRLGGKGRNFDGGGAACQDDR